MNSLQCNTLGLRVFKTKTDLSAYVCTKIRPDYFTPCYITVPLTLITCWFPIRTCMKARDIKNSEPNLGLFSLNFMLISNTLKLMSFI